MFITELDVRKLQGRKFMLLKDFVYQGSTKVTVPKGYVVNGASVPRVFWSFASPFAGDHFKPSVIHDYLCDYGGDQELADKIFYEALKNNGVSRFKSRVMYQAVKVWQKYILRNY